MAAAFFVNVFNVEDLDDEECPGCGEEYEFCVCDDELDADDDEDDYEFEED